MSAVAGDAVRRGAAIGALRRFARPRDGVERCDLCGAALAAEHEHLLDPGRRDLRCACAPCGIVRSAAAGTTWKLVRRRVEPLPAFRLSDERWAALGIPIALAFVVRSSATGHVVACYPGPAGVTESPLEPGAWDPIVADNPVLARLDADVEALLVNRTGGARSYYRMSIDECYRLTGVLRRAWRGFQGGAEVWTKVGEFFAALDAASGRGR